MRKDTAVKTYKLRAAHEEPGGFPIPSDSGGGGWRRARGCCTQLRRVNPSKGGSGSSELDGGIEAAAGGSDGWVLVSRHGK